ncbi:MAG: DUF2330 domain-containing protein [Myxococcales bacterium]|nr:DUF2330 domain-containing protein [Myxococcales bacterium]
MPISALIAAGLSSPAFACGGLFCNTAQPVIQNAERIVFSIDRESGFVDTHVQIFYEGPADEFAWIVPVPGEPELFTSSEALFDNLAFASGPIFQLNTVIEGRCATDTSVVPLSAEASFDDAGSTPTSIDIVSQGQVGPYDTVVLKADSEDALLAYLQENNYDLPDALQAVLAPYVSGDAHFVALKLSKDQDVGDITPLGMRYAGDRAMIPIQLTSVAAAPDMRLEVYVFSDQRAVPKSYLHVSINDAAVDWWGQGANYSDVISRAADETGGHAFATDYFGSVDQVAVDYTFDRGALASQTSGLQWIYELRGQGVPFNEALANVVVDHVEEPQDVDPLEFVNCPECFGSWPENAFDGAAATADLDERILTPLEETEDLYTQPLLTRMTSSLDAVEMTIDPVFVLNPDLSGEEHYVQQSHQADQVFECGAGREMFQSPRRLELADGRSIDLPSQEWFANNDMTEIEFISDLGETTAQVVSQMDEDGQAEVLFDYTDDLALLTEAHNARVRQLLGCGCNGAAAPAGSALVLLAVLGLVARRREG